MQITKANLDKAKELLQDQAVFIHEETYGFLSRLINSIKPEDDDAVLASFGVFRDDIPKEDRRYRAWYTHNMFVKTPEEIQKMAKRVRVKLSDPPTQEEVEQVYDKTYMEMSDPWEVTANGDVMVEIIPKVTVAATDEDEDK